MQLQEEFRTLKENFSNFSSSTLMEFRALDSHGELGKMTGTLSIGTLYPRMFIHPDLLGMVLGLQEECVHGPWG